MPKSSGNSSRRFFDDSFEQKARASGKKPKKPKKPKNRPLKVKRKARAPLNFSSIGQVISVKISTKEFQEAVRKSQQRISKIFDLASEDLLRATGSASLIQDFQRIGGEVARRAEDLRELEECGWTLSERGLKPPDLDTYVDPVILQDHTDVTHLLAVWEMLQILPSWVPLMKPKPEPISLPIDSIRKDFESGILTRDGTDPVPID